MIGQSPNGLHRCTKITQNYVQVFTVLRARNLQCFTTYADDQIHDEHGSILTTV